MRSLIGNLISWSVCCTLLSSTACISVVGLDTFEKDSDSLMYMPSPSILPYTLFIFNWSVCSRSPVSMLTYSYLGYSELNLDSIYFIIVQFKMSKYHVPLKRPFR